MYICKDYMGYREKMVSSGSRKSFNGLQFLQQPPITNSSLAEAVISWAMSTSMMILAFLIIPGFYWQSPPK